MTEKDKESLIGYDPLAWMNDETAEAPDASSEPVAEILIPPDTDVQDVNTAEPVAETVIESDSSKLSLDATLNIQNVTQLQEKLLSALHANEQLEIDASAVSSVDTASMQLLVILKQEAIKNNKELVFDFPSDKFIEAAELLGIAEMLAVDQAAAGFF